MSFDDSVANEHQVLVPESFIALFVPPGRIKPTLGRAQLIERYELCEDLAQMLCDSPALSRFTHEGDEARLLAVVKAQLAAQADLALDTAQTQWVLRRMAELQGWDAWPWLQASADEGEREGDEPG